MGRLGSASIDDLQQRQAEGERLARAGLGLAADVAAGDGVGDGQGLDRKGSVDAAVGQGGSELWGDAELLEGWLLHVGGVTLLATGGAGRSGRRPRLLGQDLLDGLDELGRLGLDDREKRATISPPGATRNFSKFHRMSPVWPSASATGVSSSYSG